MPLSVVPDGTSDGAGVDGSVRSETQLALFGDAVDVPIYPRAQPDTVDDPHLQAAVAAGEEQMELFLLTYPADERRAVVANLYFDAEGAPRTRHRMLAVV